MRSPSKFIFKDTAFELLRDYSFIVLGAIIQALSVVVFFAPADLAPGGISGVAFLFNRLLPVALPIGVWLFILNLPLLVLGGRYLGGWRFVARTALTVVLYSGFTALFEVWKIGGVTHDILLNTLFGAIVGGIGSGLVFRARATTGGTDILALLLVRWRSVPLSQSYLISDVLVIAFAGLSLGWEKALYALIALYVGGLAAEAVAEGVHISRTALIITDQPEIVSDAVLNQMGRGLTSWMGKGGFSQQDRPILFVVISRAETALLKAIVSDADPQAFVVIGQAQEVYGEGFRQFERK
jgi:uncharacterized membrane-anchored protein YitT (DUF2179 family)